MKQVSFCGSSDTLVNSATSYNHPFSGGNSNEAVWTATEFNREALMPTAATLRNLQIKLAAAPGGVASYAFTIRKNGVDTAITTTITGAATTGSDTTNSFSVSAGDRITLKCVPSGTPTAVAVRGWSLEWEGTAASDSINCGTTGGNLANISATVRNYGPICPTTFSTTSTNSFTTSPLSGTFKALYVRLATAPGVGKSWAFSLFINGVEDATSIFSIADAATTGNITGLSIAVSPGDTIRFSAIGTGTPALSRMQWGVLLTPATVGQSIVTGGGQGFNTSSTHFHRLNQVRGAFGGLTETDDLGLVGPTGFTLKNFYVWVNTAPGAGKSIALTVRNNLANTTITATLSGTGNTANDTTNEVSFVQNDEVSFQSVPSGTPASSIDNNWSVIQTIAVASTAVFRQNLSLLGIG